MVCALALLASPAMAAPAAQAAWGPAFEFTMPGSLDLIPTQLAVAPNGASAAAFGVQDVDTPGDSQAYVTPRSARGAVGSPLAIGSAQQVIALTYDGSALELLTGVAPHSLACCSAVQAVRLTAGGVLQRPRTLVGGLHRPHLRAAADPRRRRHAGRGGHRARRVGRPVLARRPLRLPAPPGRRPRRSPSRWPPRGLAAQTTVVAWTSAKGPTGVADPRTIYYAMGSRRGAPSKVKSLLTVPGGHRIDDLGVARRGSGATVAWVESWYDKRGNFHSEVRAADVAAHPAVRTLAGSTAARLGCRHRRRRRRRPGRLLEVVPAQRQLHRLGGRPRRQVELRRPTARSARSIPGRPRR